MIEPKSETLEYVEPFVEEIRQTIIDIVDGEMMDIDEYELFCSLLGEMIDGLPEFEVE